MALPNSSNKERGCSQRYFDCPLLAYLIPDMDTIGAKMFILSFEGTLVQCSWNAFNVSVLNRECFPVISIMHLWLCHTVQCAG